MNALIYIYVLVCVISNLYNLKFNMYWNWIYWSYPLSESPFFLKRNTIGALVTFTAFHVILETAATIKSVPARLVLSAWSSWISQACHMINGWIVSRAHHQRWLTTSSLAHFIPHFKSKEVSQLKLSKNGYKSIQKLRAKKTACLSQAKIWQHSEDHLCLS